MDGCVNIYATFLMTLSILLCLLICETASFVEKQVQVTKTPLFFFNLAVNNVYTPLVVL